MTYLSLYIEISTSRLNLAEIVKTTYDMFEIKCHKLFSIFLIGYVFGAWASNVGNSEDSGRLGQLEFFDKKLQVFDMDDLLRASAEVVGRGEFGVTYKATLETGIAVAVKRLSYMNELSKKEFIQQMQLLGQIKHENVVEIISFYHSEDQKLIIYELVSDCTLFELLHG